MGSKTKKAKAAGKFGSGYGRRVRMNFNSVESQQRKKQQSPFNKKSKLKRIAAGIWKDIKSGKIFAGPAYYIDQK